MNAKHDYGTHARQAKLSIHAGSHDNFQVAATLQAELMALGYMLGSRAFDAATRAPTDWLIA
jgi:hypothetical protein